MRLKFSSGKTKHRKADWKIRFPYLRHTITADGRVTADLTVKNFDRHKGNTTMKKEQSLQMIAEISNANGAPQIGRAHV